MRIVEYNYGRDTYECSYEWPNDCFVQCGANGIVLPRGTLDGLLLNPDLDDTLDAMEGKVDSSYSTAFFEAFPSSPSTFIRGEGLTVKQAEQSAWAKWQKIVNCPSAGEHQFEARGYENGGGFCVHCDMFAINVIVPDTKCKLCGQPTWLKYGSSWYCEGHFWQVDQCDRDGEYLAMIRMYERVGIQSEDDYLMFTNDKDSWHKVLAERENNR